jgi:Trk K+ transport system NAD-binding subunit
LREIPVIAGDSRIGVNKANCATAASLAVLTDDDMTNLEIALTASRNNENCRLVIRTDDAEFGRNVESLAPKTHSMSPYVLSAEAFAAAALGEKVISLLRLERQTVLVVEFTIEPGDGLSGELVAQIAYGYGVVAVMYKRGATEEPLFFPSDDIRVEAGARLVVLATVEGLHKIEHQTAGDREFSVRLLRAFSQSSEFEGGRIIARITGCELGAAHALMKQLPATLPVGLYCPQAFRLVRELNRASVEAEVVSPAADSELLNSV